MRVRMWSNRVFNPLLLGTQNGTVILEDCLVVSYKTQVSPYDPTTAHFGIHAKDLKTYTHTKTYTRMFTAASFTVAET